MNQNSPSWPDYLKSLADEIQVQSHRVRNLIGDSHWLTDGHHKEYLLLNLLSRFLTGSLIASRGFVISHQNKLLRSTEQDILIIDTSIEPPLFNQGGVVVSFPEAVIASVSIKTTFCKKSLHEVLDGFVSLSEITKNNNCLLCCYWFECSQAIRNPQKVESFYKKLDANQRTPLLQHQSLFCCADRYLIHSNNDRLRMNDCCGLATGLFLARLLDFIASRRGSPSIQFMDLVDYDTALIFDTRVD